MRSLTTQVLHGALDQVAQWRADGRHLAVAVNLSASSLSDADLPAQIVGALEPAACRRRRSSWRSPRSS